MRVSVVSDGTPDSEAALAYGIVKARETFGQLIALHVHQRHFSSDEAERRAAKQALQDSLRCFESLRVLIHNHSCGIPASVDFFIINDCNDIVRYASKTQIDIIVSPPAFEAMFSKARCLVDIISSEDEQSVNS